MFEATVHRALRLIPAERLFPVLSQRHFEYPEVLEQMRHQPTVRYIAQPENRDTGLGLLLALAHITLCFPNSTVAVFPSDHFISDDDFFMAHVDAALGTVERNPGKIILLGVPPTTAEPDYGYIMPDEELGSAQLFGTRVVRRFFEKPDPLAAREIVLRGGLWNTLVMVFNVSTFLICLRTINTALHRCFRRIQVALAKRNSSHEIQTIYTQASPINLSKGILEEFPKRCPQQLVVMSLRQVEWSDWGSEKRILQSLRERNNGYEKNQTVFDAVRELGSRTGPTRAVSGQPAHPRKPKPLSDLQPS